MTALLLGPPCPLAIMLVVSGERKRRQPGLTAHGPAFVGGHQLIGGVQRPKVHFYFVTRAGEQRRAAARAEKASGIIPCFTFDRHGILGKNGGSVEERAVMLATVEAVTEANPIRTARGLDANVAAQATTGESVHGGSPLHTGQSAFKIHVDQ
ncbi:hypothetical protein EMIT0P228_140065 [Pseudomonas brassicacearum]